MCLLVSLIEAPLHRVRRLLGRCKIRRTDALARNACLHVTARMIACPAVPQVRIDVYCLAVARHLAMAVDCARRDFARSFLARQPLGANMSALPAVARIRMQITDGLTVTDMPRAHGARGTGAVRAFGVFGAPVAACAAVQIVLAANDGKSVAIHDLR